MVAVTLLTIPNCNCWAVLFDCQCVGAANFIRFCFCRWLQNHTRTTFFFRSSFSAMAAIFSPDGLGWTAKYASNDRFSGAAMEVLFLEKRLDIDYWRKGGDFFFWNFCFWVFVGLLVIIMCELLCIFVSNGNYVPWPSEFLSKRRRSSFDLSEFLSKIYDL